MAICEKCKREIPEGIGYCTFCEGEKIQDDDTTQNESDTKSELDEQINKELDDIFNNIDLFNSEDNEGENNTNEINDDIKDRKKTSKRLKKISKKLNKKKSKVASTIEENQHKEDSVKNSIDKDEKEKEEDIVALSEDIKEDEEDIVALSEDIKEDEEDIVALSEDIKEDEEDIVALSEDIKEDEEDIVALSEDIKEVEEEIGPKDIENEDLIRELEEIEDIDDRNNKKSLFSKLFGNVENKKKDEKLAAAAEKAELNKKEKEKAKEKKAKEKEKEKEKKKKEKEAEADIKKKKAEVDKKKKLEEKARKKKEREEYYEQEEKGYINKLGSVILFFLFGMIVIIIIGSANVKNYKDSLSEAKDLYRQKKYEAAYEKMVSLDITDAKDKDIYNKLREIQYINKELSYYNSYIIIERYPEALDALINAVRIYQKKIVEATKMGVDKQYKEIYEEVQKCLKDKYSLTLEEAQDIATIVDKQQYSERIKEICNDL